MLGSALITGGAAPSGMRLLVCSERGAPRKGGSAARDRSRGRERRVAGSWGGGEDEGLQRQGVVDWGWWRSGHFTVWMTKNMTLFPE